MNIFWREIRSYRNGLIFWCFGMVALIGSGMLKYAAYQTTGQSILDLVTKFPRTIQIVFGMVGLDLSTARGFYGVMFLFIALMATLHAALLGTDIISKEERDRTSEFLFVKPLLRTSVITRKLLAGLMNLLIFNLVTTVGSIIIVHLVNKGASANTYIYLLMGGLLLLQLVFFFLGTAVAAASRRPKAAASIGTAVLLFTFILSYIIDFNTKLDFLKYLTPFKYFDAPTVLASGRLNTVFVMISLAITAAFVRVTYASYAKRDLKV
jgi:beta-exotoxin I transport system permease protein